YQFDLASSHINLGSMYSRTGRMREAEAAEHKALAICQRLADTNPSVTEFQRYLAGCHHNLGNTYRQTGRLNEAAAALRKAVVGRQKLASEHPKDMEFAIDLGSSYADLGNVTRDSGKPADSLDWYAQAIATLEDVGRRVEHNAVVRLGLRNSHWGRAR